MCALHSPRIPRLALVQYAEESSCVKLPDVDTKTEPQRPCFTLTTPNTHAQLRSNACSIPHSHDPSYYLPLHLQPLQNPSCLSRPPPHITAAPSPPCHAPAHLSKSLSRKRVPSSYLHNYVVAPQDLQKDCRSSTRVPHPITAPSQPPGFAPLHVMLRYLSPQARRGRSDGLATMAWRSFRGLGWLRDVDGGGGVL
jgi:hypothetical protein